MELTQCSAFREGELDVVMGLLRCCGQGLQRPGNLCAEAEEEEQAEDERIDHYIYGDQGLQCPNAGHGFGIGPHLAEPQGAHHRIHQAHGRDKKATYQQGKAKGL